MFQVFKWERNVIIQQNVELIKKKSKLKRNANGKYGAHYNVNHVASDVQYCEMLKKNIPIIISNREYRVQSILSKYIEPHAPSKKKNNINNDQSQSPMIMKETYVSQ